MAIIGICHIRAVAVDVTPELYIGPAFTSINGTTYAGVGVGGGGVLQIAPTSLGPVEVRLAAMPVFGVDLDKTFTITQVHVPLTLALSLLELPRDRRGFGLGGAIGLGVTATMGQLHDGAVFQPSAMVELTFGAFRRGALTIRYQTSIANITSPNRGGVGYNSVVFIASTAW